MSDTYGSWPQQNDTQQIGNGQPVPGQPLSLAPPAADPAAGAGWKQGIQKVAGAIGGLAGRMQFGQNGALSTQPQQGGAQQPNAQAQQNQQMMQRAQQLLKAGVISPAHFAQMTGGQQPQPGVSGAPANGVAAPQGRTAPDFNPNGPWGARDVASPTGPTSPAWNQ